MGRNKISTTRRRATKSGSRPQGEQQLSNAVWAQIVKAIRELREPVKAAA